MKDIDAFEQAYKNGYADAMASIVHCKDCKHWKEDLLCVDKNLKICEVGIYFTNGNGFCSYGERKSDNERKAD